MDTAFVTGGTGFVGANLIRRLIERGFKVRVLARPTSDRRNLKGLGVEAIEGDLSSKDALDRGAKGARFVFHVAADYRLWVTDPKAMHGANVQGTVNVIESAGRAGVEKIVHCSSVATVRPLPDVAPADERSAYASAEEIVSLYKKTKFLSEEAALRFSRQGLPVVVVNPSAPIGPLDIKPTPTGKIVVDFLNGRIPSYIDTGLNAVDVRDVAEGHLLAALKGKPGERYILGGENLTLKAMLELLADVSGRPAPKFKTPYALAYLIGAVDTTVSSILGREPHVVLDAVRMAKYHMWFDSSKAVRELGYNPRPIREAFKNAVDWFAANGYVKQPVPSAVP